MRTCVLFFECSLSTRLSTSLSCSFFHLFLMSTLVPDENSMEDPLCNSSFGWTMSHPTHLLLILLLPLSWLRSLLFPLLLPLLLLPLLPLLLSLLLLYARLVRVQIGLDDRPQLFVVTLKLLRVYQQMISQFLWAIPQHHADLHVIVQLH